MKSLLIAIVLLLSGVTTQPTTKPGDAPKITYRLSDGSEDWPADKREQIVAAMDEAVAMYNEHTNLSHELRVSYVPSVPTADANRNGHIRFGKQIGSRTALHEIAHTFGIGTTRRWREMLDNGVYTGSAADLVKQWDGDTAVLKGDRMHFWPYGLNYDREDGPERRIRHVKLVEAIVKDMDEKRATQKG